MKKVFGVATCDLTGVRGTKPYSTWKNMLRRCYSHYYYNQASYEGCTVIPEWLLYSTFKQWFDENYVEGYALDKDIIKKNNLLYSPETCCFVPQEINNLFIKRKRYRGALPIGIVLIPRNRYKKYQVQVSGRTPYSVGYFYTIEEAFQAYKKEKEKIIKERATQYFQEGKITHRVYQALMEYQVEITD